MNRAAEDARHPQPVDARMPGREPDARAEAPPAPSVPPWATVSDEDLLDLRFCDLQVSIEGSWLEERIAVLHTELDARGIQFRSYFWLSDEWFTPDGMTGIAIPFYLAHPRLAALEKHQMLEVEGGTPSWCMKILRHEVGHAIENAYRLPRRRRRQELFGRNSEPYPEYYAPRPYSRSFVLHLDPWYAQSHPAEDFAETFAVWLAPDSQWRTRYAGWPALKKLEYMDHLMREIGPKAPPVATVEQVQPIADLRTTLREHYQEKRARHGLDHPHFFDRDLRRLFSDSPQAASAMPAARFVAKIRKDVRRRVSAWTGIYQYTIDQVILDIIARCKELKLRLKKPEEETRLDFTALLTVQTMDYLHSGRHKVAL